MKLRILALAALLPLFGLAEISQISLAPIEKNSEDPKCSI